MSIYEIKDIKKTIFWSLIILIFSLIGYIAYIIFGNQLKFNAKKQILAKRKTTKNYLQQAGLKKTLIFRNTYDSDVAKYVSKILKCGLLPNNKIKIYTNGNDYLCDLLKDIKSAQNHIHLEFFIFSDDNTGKLLTNELIKKSQQGIAIKIIYDAFGSRKTKESFWKNLQQNGIHVEKFFPPILKLSYLNFKINYRNHRKIAIIDGKIAYMGGINIRNDHMGKDKKLKPWRDTQIKIIGHGVYSLQDIFLNDWYYCSQIEPSKSDLKQMFPALQKTGEYSLQVIADGPDFDKQRILSTYIKIIDTAKKFIYIQTPYFIIDKSLEDSLINAHNRGTKITIFLPHKPDKKFVFGASLININKLFNLGINIFLYNGFLHSKVLLTEEYAAIGSCNFDYRSFFLNFECTCLCNDKKFISKNLNIIKNDENSSVLLTKKQYFKLKSKNLIMIGIYKIISKIL